MFSAVVTAYTIESYQWLQPDSGDQTVQLLAQISSQLASFSVTPAFINTTIQPMLAPPPFHPSDVDVTINMLWFLSLNLSLLAAFFAIAVQQWLRYIPLPQHLGANGTIYLRQKRHQAFVMCQVPHLITLLPVMLQISVVLFLAGLYHFLRGLSHPITTAVTVVAGTPFIFYAISLFLPLIWPECPFKSPLVPSIVFVLQWTLILILLLATLLLLIPVTLASIIGVCFWVFCTKGEAETDSAMDAAFDKIMKLVMFAVGVVGHRTTSALLHPGNFWADREYRRYSHETDDWDLSLPLSWAPNAVPVDQLSRLRPCLLQFEVGQRTRCVMEWIILPYMGKFNAMDYGQRGYEWSPVHREILQAVNTTFARQYKTYLLDAVPTAAEAAECDWVRTDQDLAAVLVLLMQTVLKVRPVEPEFRADVVSALMRLLRGQRLSSGDMENGYGDYSMARFPAICLYKCAADGRYAFTSEGMWHVASSSGTF